MDQKTQEPRRSASAKQTVELFDARLIHAGNKDHEIQLRGVSAREIHLLRAMHGEGAVVDRSIKPSTPATREVEPKIELFEMARKYANTADPMSGKRAVEKAFGTALVGFELWHEEALEMERMEQEEAMRKRQEEGAQRRREALLAAAKEASAA